MVTIDSPICTTLQHRWRRNGQGQDWTFSSASGLQPVAYPCCGAAELVPCRSPGRASAIFLDLLPPELWLICEGLCLGPRALPGPGFGLTWHCLVVSCTGLQVSGLVVWEGAEEGRLRLGWVGPGALAGMDWVGSG